MGLIVVKDCKHRSDDYPLLRLEVHYQQPNNIFHAMA